MSNGEFDFSPDFLGQKLSELASVASDKRNMLRVMCESVIVRIKLSPSAYLRFGPYWWAVKQTLTDNGFNLGQTVNPLMANRFMQSSPELTIIAGWECADHVQANYFDGTRDFTLDAEGEDVFSLFDPDMEATNG